MEVITADRKDFSKHHIILCCGESSDKRNLEWPTSIVSALMIFT